MGAAKDRELYLYANGCGHYIPTKQRPWLPESVRREVVERAKGCCEFCRKRCVGEIHHETYSHLYQTHDNTPATRLFYLCRECHQKEHTDPFGKFWIDPEEMEDFFAGYHKAMEDD